VVTLTVVDQGASSVSNFGLSVLVAHYSGAHELGIFTLVISTYILCQGLVRSVTSDCLLTRTGAEQVQKIKIERAGYLAALVVAIVMSVVLLAVAAVVSNAFAIPLVIFAISFPFMALQDYSRYIGISRHLPGYAIRLDIAWIVLFVAAFVVLRANELVSLPWLFGAWTGAGAVVGIATLPAHLRARSGLQLLRFWVRTEFSIGIRFAGQFLVGTSWAYFILYLLVFFISIDGIGLIKIAQLALGPMVVLFSGVQSALVSIISKKWHEDQHGATRFLQLAGVAMTITMVGWTIVIYLLPANLVADVLGRTWPQAREFVLWLGFAAALGSVSAVAGVGLRAMRAAKELLWLSVIMVPFLFVFPLGGAQLGGVRGFAIGMVGLFAIYAVLGWLMFVRTARRFESAQPATPVS
jgi:O-antigen/teichoic acid export membrane protein